MLIVKFILKNPVHFKLILFDYPINDVLKESYSIFIYTGADSGGGGAHPARAPPPPPPKIRKNMIFWRKIVIFHTKYPKNVRASLRSALFF
jgi:hypothetical protein